jgi:hypothetical protein
MSVTSVTFPWQRLSRLWGGCKFLPLYTSTLLLDRVSQKWLVFNCDRLKFNTIEFEIRYSKSLLSIVFEVIEYIQKLNRSIHCSYIVYSFYKQPNENLSASENSAEFDRNSLSNLYKFMSFIQHLLVRILM